MDKLSGAKVNEIMKVSAATLRAMSEENQQLKTKVAFFQKKEQAEKVATLMEEKGLNENLSYNDKVASLMEREDLTVMETAVGMSAPQMKLASVDDDGETAQVVSGFNDLDSNQAASTFETNLTSLE